MHGGLSHFSISFPLWWINQSVQVDIHIYVYICAHVHTLILVSLGVYEIALTFVLTAMSSCLPITLNLDPVNDQSALTRPHG